MVLVAAGVEIYRAPDIKVLANPGVTSLQLLSPRNCPGADATITKVTVEPSAGQPRHVHESAEQVWIVLQGAATLLLAGSESQTISAADVVRTPAGKTHGLQNDGAEPFVYLAVTTPPVDFGYAYREQR
jgi:quercetin dioxygenase-like cupin family protein